LVECHSGVRGLLRLALRKDDYIKDDWVTVRLEVQPDWLAAWSWRPPERWV